MSKCKCSITCYVKKKRKKKKRWGDCSSLKEENKDLGLCMFYKIFLASDHLNFKLSWLFCLTSNLLHHLHCSSTEGTPYQIPRDLGGLVLQQGHSSQAQLNYLDNGYSPATLTLNCVQTNIPFSHTLGRHTAAPTVKCPHLPSQPLWCSMVFDLHHTDCWQMPIHTMTSEQKLKSTLGSLFETTKPQLTVTQAKNRAQTGESLFQFPFLIRNVEE